MNVRCNERTLHAYSAAYMASATYIDLGNCVIKTRFLSFFFFCSIKSIKRQAHKMNFITDDHETDN